MTDSLIIGQLGHGQTMLTPAQARSGLVALLDDTHAQRTASPRWLIYLDPSAVLRPSEAD
jgi:hypothetical protein